MMFLNTLGVRIYGSENDSVGLPQARRTLSDASGASCVATKTDVVGRYRVTRSEKCQKSSEIQKF